MVRVVAVTLWVEVVVFNGKRQPNAVIVLILNFHKSLDLIGVELQALDHPLGFLGVAPDFLDCGFLVHGAYVHVIWPLGLLVKGKWYRRG